MSEAVLTGASPAAPGNLIDGAARRLVLQRLSALTVGELVLHEDGCVTRFGGAGGLRAALRIHRPRFFRDAVLGGTLSVAESYLRGDWDCDDLTALFRVFVQNGDAASRFNQGLAPLLRLAHRAYHWWHANSRSGSRRNIAAHYDLGNDFFRLMLDDTLAYSSGIFPSPAASLREASVEKFDRVCRKLNLRPGDHLLEIGTGWGGLALHAAGQYGCRVTTTTISRQQYAVAKQRITDAGLQDRVTLLLQDYRDLHGQFDKLASIEMIEAVGHRYLDGYFRQCSRLLKSHGTLVLQAIVMPDQEHARYLKSVDFIQRYVFPGGCLPSVGAMLSSTTRATDLRLVHLEGFAPHYAQTLREWRRRFEDRLSDVRRLGYDDRFVRLWRYYLCYCEAAFDERCTSVVQVQFDKPACRRDPLQIAASAAHSAVPSAATCRQGPAA